MIQSYCYFFGLIVEAASPSSGDFRFSPAVILSLVISVEFPPSVFFQPGVQNCFFSSVQNSRFRGFFLSTLMYLPCEEVAGNVNKHGTASSFSFFDPA